MTEWFMPLDLTSEVPWEQFSNLLLYGFVLSSPEFKLIVCVISQLVSLPPSWDMFHLLYLVIHLECPKLNTFSGFLETFFLARGSMLSYI